MGGTVATPQLDNRVDSISWKPADILYIQWFSLCAQIPAAGCDSNADDAAKIMPADTEATAGSTKRWQYVAATVKGAGKFVYAYGPARVIGLARCARR